VKERGIGDERDMSRRPSRAPSRQQSGRNTPVNERQYGGGGGGRDSSMSMGNGGGRSKGEIPVWDGRGGAGDEELDDFDDGIAESSLMQRLVEVGSSPPLSPSMSSSPSSSSSLPRTLKTHRLSLSLSLSLSQCMYVCIYLSICLSISILHRQTDKRTTPQGII